MDKGIPPLSFEEMPFYWFEGYLGDWLEELKQRKKEQEEYDSKKGDSNFMSKVRNWGSFGKYGKSPSLKGMK